MTLPDDVQQALQAWAVIDQAVIGFRRLGEVLRSVPIAIKTVTEAEARLAVLTGEIAASAQRQREAEERDAGVRTALSSRRDAERDSWHQTRDDLKKEVETERQVLEALNVNTVAQRQDAQRLREEIGQAEARLAALRRQMRELAEAALKDK